MENNLDADDKINANDEIKNNYCITYLRKHIRESGNKIGNGILVISYLWCFIDLIIESIEQINKRYHFVFNNR
ncbi:MAG: family 1 glycosylhydrolase [Candidatus Malihini olakiniferum]